MCRHGRLGGHYLLSSFVHFLWRHIVQPLVRTFVIVEIEVLAYPESRFEWTVVGVQVDLFIFNASPKPLYKDVVDAATFAKQLKEVSSHSTRVGVNQDYFAAGEDLAGIMDALRWKSPRMPLLYNRSLAAEQGAAGRLLSKMD